VPYRRKKLTFAISSPDEFLYTAAINYVSLCQKLFEVFTDEQRFAVLHDTWRIGGAPVNLAAILSVSVRLIAKTVNRNISEFLSKGRLCLSAYDMPKTRNCTNQRNHNLKKTFPFLVGGRGPIS